MALKIIGAGYGRTGTDSTKTALNALGFPCYHMYEVLQNPANKDHLGFWKAVSEAPPNTQHDWEAVFANYTAAVDNPAACVWRELLEAYPDAKVLLTLHPRGPDAWYDSTMETIYFTERMWQWKVLEWVLPFAKAFGPMARNLVWKRFHKGTMPRRATAIAQYRAHIDEVKAAVPEDRLLIFQVDQGWKPLCDFLGVPIPDGEFPRVNDRAQIQETIKNMTRGAYTILGIGAIALMLVIAGSIHLLE